MAELLFLVACFVPPAVIVLSAAMLAIASMPRRSEAPARLRAHHA
jgi:hypothetical protein